MAVVKEEEEEVASGTSDSRDTDTLTLEGEKASVKRGQVVGATVKVKNERKKKEKV